MPSGERERSSRASMRRAVSDEDKGRRRAELLVAAREVFAEKGYHDTKMADVAGNAGLSYGVAYWYFDSKDDLFKATMSAEEGRLRASITDAITASGASESRDVLQAGVAATFTYFDSDPVAGALLFRAPFTLGHDVERHLFGIFGRFIDEIGAAVEVGRRAGSTGSTPHHLVAFAIASLVSSVAMRRLRTDDGMSADQAAAFVVTVVFDGIASSA